jgi:hypothetical protein
MSSAFFARKIETPNIEPFDPPKGFAPIQAWAPGLPPGPSVDGLEGLKEGAMNMMAAHGIFLRAAKDTREDFNLFPGLHKPVRFLSFS